MTSHIAHRKSRESEPDAVVWWFGSGSLPAWQIHGGIMYHWLYRPRHLFNRPNAESVQSIAEGLSGDVRKLGRIGGWDLVEVDGQEFFMLENVQFTIPKEFDIQESPCTTITIAPLGEVMNFPALLHDDGTEPLMWIRNVPMPPVGGVEPWHGKAGESQ